MIATTELCVLGGLTLRRDARAESLGGPKAQLLLSVLVAHRRDRVSLSRLTEALWGGEPPSSATATIQTHVSRLRSVLAPDFAITHDAAGYQIESLSTEVDASRFESLLAQSRTADPARSITILETALDLWSGPAYERFADAPEIQSEATRLDELRLVATDAWAEAKMAAGDPASMVGELEALVALHPLRECYWRLLMLALYRTGRQAESLRRAAEFRAVLREEVGLDLPTAIRELEAQVLADDPRLIADSTPPADMAAVTAAAPRLLGATSFIGRDPTLASLSNAISDHQLVTIVGPGGVGKTRLAMRLAGNNIDQFDDGVIVVEFAPLRDPQGVAQVIANALDVQQRRHRTIETTIEEFLASSRSLLLLDNCEHVTETVAPLVDRLRSSCPELRILVTSRQPLGLAGEYIDVLAPLIVPAPGVETAAELRQSSAAELFIGRSEVASPGFTVTDDNARAVADICRRLDGIPLALELAAARLRTMSVDAVAARLHHRIDVPGQKLRGADGRQRSLHDLVRWSHDLLDPPERLAFEQLAVFAGGFDLAAAEYVCAVDGGESSVLGHLASLVDQSMVVLVDPDIPRYRLLEPLREFALDHLRDRGELDTTEDRHLDWFLGYAERGAVGLDTGEEGEWSAALERDFDNMRVAFRTATRRDDPSAALRLVFSLREFSFRRVLYEITTWAEDAITLDGADDSPELSGALAVAAYGRFVRGDTQTAIELADRSLTSSEGPELSASGLPERVLVNAYYYLDRPEEAFRWITRMMLSARRSDSSGQLAHVLYMQSVGATSTGDGIRGAMLAGEAKAAAEAAGSPTAHAQAAYAIGLAIEGSEPDEALTHLERAGVVAADAGNRWVAGFALTEVHSLRARQGDHLAALRGYAEVVDMWFRGGDWANQWLSLRRVLGLLAETSHPDKCQAASV